jgi:hypothetical protein
VILRFGLLEHAKCAVPKSALDNEQKRQFIALQATMAKHQETQRRMAQWL